MNITDNYAWDDRNRESRFATWGDEVDYMHSLGFSLVRPDFKVVGWAERLQSPESRPILFVSSPYGPREMDANLDRHAAELGYPLYCKTPTV